MQDREFIEMEMPHNGQPQSQRPASGGSQSAGSRTPSPSRLTATSPTAKSTSSRKKDRGVHYPPSSPSAAESPANCCPPWCLPLNRNRPGPLLSVRCSIVFTFYLLDASKFKGLLEMDKMVNVREASTELPVEVQ
jgi:hypothetical protein